MRHFSDVHPYIQLLYFVTVLSIVMFTINPVIITISVIGGLAYTCIVDRDRLISRIIMIPVMSTVLAVINAAMSHNGSSVLFYMNNRRITYEALVYGAMMGIILSDVVIWTMCMSRVLTRDRLVYIFGRFPVTAVVISMTFRYIPLFTDKYRSISNCNKITGRYKDRNYYTRLKSNLDCLMILITWILENGADTADSMEKRGFMTGRRSHFVHYKMRLWDYIVMLISMLSITGLIYLKYTVTLNMEFYPCIVNRMSVGSIVLIPLYIIPLVVELKEEIRWRFLVSRI